MLKDIVKLDEAITRLQTLASLGLAKLMKWALALAYFQSVHRLIAWERVDDARLTRFLMAVKGWFFGLLGSGVTLLMMVMRWHSSPVLWFAAGAVLVTGFVCGVFLLMCITEWERRQSHEDD